MSNNNKISVSSTLAAHDNKSSGIESTAAKTSELFVTDIEYEDEVIAGQKLELAEDSNKDGDDKINKFEDDIVSALNDNDASDSRTDIDAKLNMDVEVDSNDDEDMDEYDQHILVPPSQMNDDGHDHRIGSPSKSSAPRPPGTSSPINSPKHLPPRCSLLPLHRLYSTRSVEWLRLAYAADENILRDIHGTSSIDHHGADSCSNHLPAVESAALYFPSSVAAVNVAEFASTEFIIALFANTMLDLLIGYPGTAFNMAGKYYYVFI